jgi:hypothetical protein
VTGSSLSICTTMPGILLDLNLTARICLVFTAEFTFFVHFIGDQCYSPCTIESQISALPGVSTSTSFAWKDVALYFGSFCNYANSYGLGRRLRGGVSLFTVCLRFSVVMLTF